MKNTTPNTSGSPRGSSPAFVNTPSPVNKNGSRYYGNQVKVVRKGGGPRLNTLGDQITVKLTGKDTRGQYSLVEQNNEPGAGIPLHVHEKEDEVFKLIEGVVEFTINDQITLLKGGDMIFCPRGIPHAWRVVGPGKAKVDLGFFPAGMELMLQELASLPTGPPDFAMVSEICGRYGVRFIQA